MAHCNPSKIPRNRRPKPKSNQNPSVLPPDILPGIPDNNLPPTAALRSAIIPRRGVHLLDLDLARVDILIEQEIQTCQFTQITQMFQAKDGVGIANAFELE